MLAARDIRQPVDVARVLQKFGLSLRRAHDVLTRLARGGAVAAELHMNDVGELFSALSSVGVDAALIRIPDVDVKGVRDRFGLSQADFALRFGLEVDTVRNWEQGRNTPDQSTRLLLKIIESYPEVVEAVLTNRQRQPDVEPYPTMPASAPSPENQMGFHEEERAKYHSKPE
jgi:DNA-binding transcriptional regulator YiaG